MYEKENFEKISSFFNALGSPVRLKILMMVIETQKPLHIKAVSKNLKMDYATIYRHIEVLKKANLIKIFEVGRSRVLSLNRVEEFKKFFEKAKEIVNSLG
ncbi:MAG: winged helix-turn-helix domain-containing protein [Candidatus Bathyarchaeia archaeon]